MDQPPSLELGGWTEEGEVFLRLPPMRVEVKHGSGIKHHNKLGLHLGQTP